MLSAVCCFGTVEKESVGEKENKIRLENCFQGYVKDTKCGDSLA